EHTGLGLIQIDQDIAGILANRVRLKVHVVSIAVARAQEFHDRFLPELRSRPQTRTRQWSTAEAVNQANEIPFARHGGELAMNGLERQRQSAIRHHGMPPGLNHVGHGVGPKQSSPCTGKLSKRPEDNTGFNRPKRVCDDAQPTNSAAFAFIATGSALSWRAPSTYHGIRIRPWKRRHFYFARNTTFLLCLDTPQHLA